jgi:hypothetical protein
VVSVLLNRGDGTFAEKVDYTITSGTYGINSGDLNTDGHSDLVVTSYSGTVHVLINNGTGEFPAKASWPAGPDARSVAVGDFNNDLKPDLAIANEWGNTLTLLRNTTTAAGLNFAAEGTLPVPNQPYSVVARDFDGDGRADLAVSCWNGSVLSVGKSISTATKLSFGMRLDYDVDSTPRTLVVADFDGDADPDIALPSDATAGRVNLLRNDGNGGFGKLAIPRAVQVSSISAGDLDGDGWSDLVVNNTTGNTVSVLWNNRAGGFSASDPTVGTTTAASVAGDFTGDGRLDLAVIGSGVWLLVNNGSRTFTAQSILTITGNSITAADFNRDGRLDMAIGGATIQTRVLLNDGAAGFAAIAYPVTAARVAVADVNRDGAPDVLATRTNGTYVLRNRGDGILIVGESYGVAGTPADLDGDQWPDLVYAGRNPDGVSSTIGMLRNRGDGTFTAGPSVVVPQLALLSIVGDLDGDGVMDLAVSELVSGMSIGAVALFRYVGGAIVPSRRYFAGANPVVATAADLNRDGGPDLTIFNRDRIRTFMNTSPLPGDANADKTVDAADFQILHVNFGASNASRAMGDFNLDGIVNFADFQILERNFGRSILSPAPAPLAASSKRNESPVVARPLPVARFAFKRIARR